MFINRWMDTEIVVHIYNGILLSYKKNAFESVLMRWMNLEPVAEWSRSEKEKQTLYITACVWNLERWYWWTYLQGSNGDTREVPLHSSTLAWRIPWVEEPGRLQSMGSLRVRHDWATSLSLFTFMHWRRKWQPTPVFLPGESQGWQSLVCCHLWGHTESDTTEVA